MFYVSLKGTCDSCFLQEAYEGSKLKEKDPLALLKERMPELAAQGKKAETIDDDNDDWDDDNEQDDDSVRDRKVKGKQNTWAWCRLSCFTIWIEKEISWQLESYGRALSLFFRYGQFYYSNQF